MQLCTALHCSQAAKPTKPARCPVTARMLYQPVYFNRCCSSVLFAHCFVCSFPPYPAPLLPLPSLVQITPAKDGRPVIIELVDTKTKEPKGELQVGSVAYSTL